MKKLDKLSTLKRFKTASITTEIMSVVATFILKSAFLRKATFYKLFIAIVGLSIIYLNGSFAQSDVGLQDKNNVAESSKIDSNEMYLNLINLDNNLDQNTNDDKIIAHFKNRTYVPTITADQTYLALFSEPLKKQESTRVKIDKVLVIKTLELLPIVNPETMMK